MKHSPRRAGSTGKIERAALHRAARDIEAGKPVAPSDAPHVVRALTVFLHLQFYGIDLEAMLDKRSKAGLVKGLAALETALERHGRKKDAAGLRSILSRASGYDRVAEMVERVREETTPPRSVHEASKIVADKLGRDVDSVRPTYYRRLRKLKRRG